MTSPGLPFPPFFYYLPPRPYAGAPGLRCMYIVRTMKGTKARKPRVPPCHPPLPPCPPGHHRLSGKRTWGPSRGGHDDQILRGLSWSREDRLLGCQDQPARRCGDRHHGAHTLGLEITSCHAHLLSSCLTAYERGVRVRGRVRSAEAIVLRKELFHGMEQAWKRSMYDVLPRSVAPVLLQR